jgi:hypothetical protein
LPRGIRSQYRGNVEGRPPRRCRLMLVAPRSARYNAAMVKTLELAITKAAELPEAAQEQLGRELLDRIDTLARLRTELQLGIDELDAGLGEPLDIEEVIAQARKEHGTE